MVNFPGDLGIAITWPTSSFFFSFFGLYISFVNRMTFLVHSYFKISAGSYLYGIKKIISFILMPSSRLCLG